MRKPLVLAAFAAAGGLAVFLALWLRDSSPAPAPAVQPPPAPSAIPTRPPPLVLPRARPTALPQPAPRPPPRVGKPTAPAPPSEVEALVGRARRAPTPQEQRA